MSRKDEDLGITWTRWAASMTGGKILGPQAERNPSDVAHQKARDDANNRGADAWSPSRAREALRRYLLSSQIVSCAWEYVHSAEFNDAFADETSLREWALQRAPAFVHQFFG